MAVSVPPPLYHLNSVAKFRDDSATTTATTSMTSSTSLTSTKTKNKRKSLEPKKLATTTAENSFSKRIKIENCHEGSDGEQTHSPSSTSSSSTSTSSSDGLSLSPQSSMLAPKKRFKQEALKYLEESSRQQSEKSNPFRPWDIEATSPTVKTPVPPSPNPIPFLYNPLQNFFPISPGFLLQPHPALIATPKIEPSLPTSPDLSSLKFQKSQPSEAKRTSPPFYPALSSSSLTPKIEPSTSPSPSPLSLTSGGLKPSQFDAETCQVLSRLYPFLLNRPSATSEPEQDEPLALVKRKTEDDDDVFIKQEANDSGSENPSGSGKSKQRNYKNMTRERRIEANARERQRVHTITAAFDRLQGAIPTADDAAGSSANKLSKLSIIKIATSYIMVLSRMAGHDYSMDQSEPSIEECIKQCADLVKAEAKSRKKSSESSDW